MCYIDIEMYDIEMYVIRDVCDIDIEMYAIRHESRVCVIVYVVLLIASAVVFNGKVCICMNIYSYRKMDTYDICEMQMHRYR